MANNFACFVENLKKNENPQREERVLPDCQVMAVEELKQNLQLCNFLFHRNPLDQN